MYMSKDTVASSAGTPAASIPPPRSSQQCWHTAPLYQFTSVMGWTKPGREGKWKQNSSEDVGRAFQKQRHRLEVPKCPAEVPRNERGCRGWGGWEERAMKRMSRTRRKGRIRMTTVTTMNDESSFLPNGSAKLKCQTHDARMRMIRMLQRFSMIQTTQMTGMIKVIRMNQWWG